MRMKSPRVVFEMGASVLTNHARGERVELSGFTLTHTEAPCRPVRGERFEP
jgi:hypothetical protein